MVQHLFTIIIPTKNRADTLYWALKTCVEQDYNNLQIIISDNSSTDNTREVTLGFKDTRIQYINTGTPLSMSGNWEFALSHVKEGFVSFLGDDDAFLPGAITRLNKIVNETGCLAIGAACIEYNWPNHVNPMHRNKSYFIKNNIETYPDVKKLLSEVLASRLPYSVLPWLYKGFVSMEVLQRIKSQTGLFFNSRTPDVYSALVIASNIDSKKFFYSSEPFAINGASSHSNGISQGVKVKNAGAMEYVSSLSIPFHKDLVLINSFPIYVFECYLQGRDAGVIKTNGKPPVEVEQVLESTMKQAQYNKKESYEDITKSIVEIAIKNNIPQQRLNHILKKYPNKNILSKIMSKTKNRYFSSVLQIDMNEYNVTNVYEAAVIADKILKKEIKGDAARVISMIVKDIKTIITKR